MTTPTTPCLRCHTPGGYRKPHHAAPHRARGLCSRCYEVVYREGKIGDYPRKYHRAATRCLGCRETFDRWVRHNGRGLCQACYERALNHGVVNDYPGCGPRPVPYAPAAAEHPDIPTGIVTPAMLGIKPGQPPTDPGLMPKKVWEVGNVNARRALQWLTAHTGIEETQALARVVWMPALLDTEARKAA